MINRLFVKGYKQVGSYSNGVTVYSNGLSAYVNIITDSMTFNKSVWTNLATLTDYKPINGFTYSRTSVTDLWGCIDNSGLLKVYNSSSANKTNTLNYSVYYPINPRF